MPPFQIGHTRGFRPGFHIGRGRLENGDFNPSDLDGAYSLHDVRQAEESNGAPLVDIPETIGGLTATATTSSNQATTVVQSSQPTKYADADGLDDFYQCATASDWTHLHSGDASILCTIAIPSGLAGTKTICATTVNGTGVVLFWTDTNQVQLFVFDAGARPINGVTSDAGLVVAGEGFVTFGVTYGPGGTVEFYRNGELFSSHTPGAYTAPTGDPTAALALLGRTNGSAVIEADFSDLLTANRLLTADDAAKYHAWSLG